MSSGLFGQIMSVAETTYGTRVVPTKGIIFVEEGLQRNEERIETTEIRAGWLMPHSASWAIGKRSPGGPINMRLHTFGQGLLWASAFGGTPVTTGAGPYVHTYSPGVLPSMTVQVGRPFVASATVQPFDYLGCMVASWELSCVAGEIANFNVELLAQEEKTDQTLATAVYPAGTLPMTFVHGAVTVAAGALPVKDITVGGDNGLDDSRFFLGGAGKRQDSPQNAERSYTFAMNADFDALTNYNRIVNGTEAALVLTFTQGANLLVLTGNARFDNATPVVGGPQVLGQPLRGKFVASGATEDTGIKVVRTTTEATATA